MGGLGCCLELIGVSFILASVDSYYIFQTLISSYELIETVLFSYLSNQLDYVSNEHKMEPNSLLCGP